MPGKNHRGGGRGGGVARSYPLELLLRPTKPGCGHTEPRSPSCLQISAIWDPVQESLALGNLS